MRRFPFLIRVGGLLALLALAGCATTRPVVPPNSAWTQHGPDGRVELRAIVAGDASCPSADLDGRPQPMQVRAGASAAGAASAGGNPAHSPAFEVKSCELALPAGTRAVRIGDRALPVPVAAARRIVVVGDTGCRIKVAFSGQGDPVQDCTDPAAWPWPRLAVAAAAQKPDLVIHVGDFHYREYCDDPAVCAALAAKGVVVSYGWAGWSADFFAPAAPLLAAAPWIFVRGNHENCDRAGEGWMRFLSPSPYAACPDQRYRTATRSRLGNNRTADAYRVDLGPVSLLVADNAGHEDYRPAADPDDAPTFARTLATLRDAPSGRPLWFVSHRPIWYDLLAPEVQPNAFQATLKRGLADRLQLAFGGHIHAFETLNFAAGADRANYPSGRPAQVVVGGGGTQLEAFDPRSPFYEGVAGPGSRERAAPDGRLYDGVAAASGLLLHRYSFLLLDRKGDGWDARVIDPDGATIVRCRLDDGRKELACPAPGR